MFGLRERRERGRAKEYRLDKEVIGSIFVGSEEETFGGVFDILFNI